MKVTENESESKSQSNEKVACLSKICDIANDMNISLTSEHSINIYDSCSAVPQFSEDDEMERNNTCRDAYSPTINNKYMEDTKSGELSKYQSTMNEEIPHQISDNIADDRNIPVISKYNINAYDSCSGVFEEKRDACTDAYSPVISNEYVEDFDSEELNKSISTMDEKILHGTNGITTENTSWISFVGSFANILEMLEDSKKLFNELNTCNVMNEKRFAVQAASCLKSFKEECEKSLFLGENIIKKFESDETKIIYSESSEELNCLVNHDPGLRNPIKSDAQRDYLISLGPHQPKLTIFPSDGKDRFNPKWYEEYKFLEYSVAKNRAFCFVCYLFPSGVGRNKSEDNWYSGGVADWGKMKSRGKGKLGKLSAHFSSNSHKAALESYCSFLHKMNYVDIKLDNKKRKMQIEREKQLNFNKKIVEILFDLTNTMARQGLAFRENTENKEEETSSNFYQLIKLISRHNPLLNKWLEEKKLRPYKVSYLSPQSQNEFISIIADNVRSKIVQEIQSCVFFTVMADTTPDMSHKDMLSVVIRICDKLGNPKEYLLEIRESLDKTGLGIAKDIVNILHTNQIDLNFLSFQSYDFASCMSGEFNGTQKKISEIVNHNVPYVPCQDHRVNTALEHCIRASSIVSDLFDTLQEMYVFFTSSPKRFRPLKVKMMELENALSLKNLSKTRWVARAESLRAVTNSFEKITELLEDISFNGNFDSATKSKASGLRKKMLTFCHYNDVYENYIK